MCILAFYKSHKNMAAAITGAFFAWKSIHRNFSEFPSCKSILSAKQKGRNAVECIFQKRIIFAWKKLYSVQHYYHFLYCVDGLKEGFWLQHKSLFIKKSMNCCEENILFHVSNKNWLFTMFNYKSKNGEIGSYNWAQNKSQK